MAGGVIIDGKFTANPDVYATLVYGQGAGQPPSQGAVAIVGEFPFLEQNTPYAFTSQAALEQVAPNLPLVKRLANAVYNPSNDPATPGVPRAVYLVSPKATTQATTLLNDSGSDATLQLDAQIWGPRGNQTRFSIAPNTGLGGSDIVITNNGYREVFRVPAESSALTLGYDYPAVVAAGTTGYGFEDDGAGSGAVTVTQDGSTKELDVTFSRTLPGSTAFASTHPSWYPTDPANPPGPVVFGQLTFAVTAISLTTATTLSALITGFNALGAADTETVVISAAGPGLITAMVISTKSWSQVTSVAFYTNVTERWAVSAVDTGAPNRFTLGATPHGLVAGDPVRMYALTGGTLGTYDVAQSFVAETTYYVHSAPTTTTIKLTLTPGGGEVGLETAGTGTFYFHRAPTTRTSVTVVDAGVTDDVTATAHGLIAGNPIRFYIGGGGTLPTHSGGTPISSGTTYYVLNAFAGAHADKFRVSLTSGGAALVFDNDGTFPFYVQQLGGEVTGNIVTTGTNFDTLGPTAESNLTTLADLITYVSGFSAYGFTASTGSPRAASIPIVELDQTATAGQAMNYTFAADLWKLKTTINSNSLLVQADYAPSSSYLPVYVPVAGIANYLSGGTVTDATADNWTAAYASLTWLDINSVLVFIDDDYAPAPDTTRAAQHAAALDHAIYMNGVGANPRDAWGAASAQETLSALTTRVVALNSQLFTLIEDEDYAVQYTGAAERLDPVWYALKLCSMVNGNPRTSLVGCHPRSLGFYRRDDLSTREGTSELLRSGVTCMVQPPGETGPKVQRWVTTYVTNPDPARPEGAAVRSELDSIRGVQWALRPPAGQTGTNAFGATLLAAARAELSRQVDAGVIASFDNASLKVTEYADRWSVSYAFAPAFPVNFVLINATVSVPTSSFTAAA